MRILTRAEAIQGQLSQWRRDFHRFPELGFQEQRTARIVAETCERIGMRVRRAVGRTGVVAELGSGKPVIAVRADMDALPIQEMNPVEYCSQVAGIMHACGHDAHISMALGAATLLKEEPLRGTVRFLFQPCEEVGDEEGKSGSTRMIEDGAMEGVQAVIAQHVDASTAVGNIRNDPGPASGGVDSWFATIRGKGGHGARPYSAHDPIYMSAFVIQALNGLISRRIHPYEPAVVSIGAIHAGDAENVIPDAVELKGTLRYAETGTYETLRAEIRHAFELVLPLGGEFDLRFEYGGPPMINDPEVVRVINAVAAEIVGEEHVLPFPKELDAEDFGNFSSLAPGAMYTLGARIEGDVRTGHNPRFDINEAALPIGSAILAATVLRLMDELG